MNIGILKIHLRLPENLMKCGVLTTKLDFVHT